MPSAADTQNMLTVGCTVSNMSLLCKSCDAVSSYVLDGAPKPIDSQFVH
jgi:hypothetical protein